MKHAPLTETQIDKANMLYWNSNLKKNRIATNLNTSVARVEQAINTNNDWYKAFIQRRN